MNLGDVSEVEELTEPEFTYHVDSADISTSEEFIVLGFVYKKSRFRPCQRG